MDAYADYEGTRFEFDPRRQMVWNEIIGYLEELLGKPSSLLDIGAGYCTAVNASSAKRKYACDIRPEFAKYAKPEVKTHVGSCEDLTWLPEGESLDWVIASNLLEHLPREILARCLSAVRERLHPFGSLIVIQPNFRLCYRSYFDDYTHLPESIFTEISMADYLRTQGFEPTIVRKGFLPFSMKEEFPVHRLFIAAYLRSPFKPWAAQMLVVARPAAGI